MVGGNPDTDADEKAEAEKGRQALAAFSARLAKAPKAPQRGLFSMGPITPKPMIAPDSRIFYLAPCGRCSGMFDSRTGQTHPIPDCDLEIIRQIMES